MKNKLIAFGGVDLVINKIKKDFDAWNDIRPTIENLLKESNFFEGMKFWWVGFIYRYGIKNELIPEYQRINKKYGDLPIAIELRADILSWADQNNIDLMEDIFMVGALEALIHVAHKYKLPTELLEKARSKYKNIPESVEECKDIGRLLET